MWQFLTQNWVGIAFVAAMLAMHLGGHRHGAGGHGAGFGGCGSHAGHAGHGDRSRDGQSGRQPGHAEHASRVERDRGHDPDRMTPVTPGRPDLVDRSSAGRDCTPPPAGSTGGWQDPVGPERSRGRAQSRIPDPTLDRSLDAAPESTVESTVESTMGVTPQVTPDPTRDALSPDWDGPLAGDARVGRGVQGASGAVTGEPRQAGLSPQSWRS